MVYPRTQISPSSIQPHRGMLLNMKKEMSAIPKYQFTVLSLALCPEGAQDIYTLDAHAFKIYVTAEMNLHSQIASQHHNFLS